jgi:hypothetical protein
MGPWTNRGFAPRDCQDLGPPPPRPMNDNRFLLVASFLPSDVASVLPVCPRRCHIRGGPTHRFCVCLARLCAALARSPVVLCCRSQRV